MGEAAILLKVFKWVATAFQVAGVFMLATRVADPPCAYAVMLVGSVAWLVIGALIEEWAIAMLNAAFTVSNIIGIFTWS